MNHATAAALDRLEPLLADIRAIAGLTEKSRGVFYRRSKAYLHFHEDSAGLFADVRNASSDFDRYRVETEAERAAFLAALTAPASAGPLRP